MRLWRRFDACAVKADVAEDLGTKEEEREQQLPSRGSRGEAKASGDVAGSKQTRTMAQINAVM